MSDDRLEFAAVLTTAAGHLTTVAWPVVHGIFIAVAILGWLVWIVRTLRVDPERVRLWGFTTHNLGASVARTAAFMAVAALGLAVIGWWRGALTWEWHFLFAMLLYPLWGLIQQLLVNGVLARSLRQRLGPVVTTLIAAALFGLIHVPFPALMGATFVLGLVLTPLYLIYGNLWPLAFAHGWLGTLVYPWVLGRDPWLEIVGGL
ncbi:MAG: membrane protease YdiL (CAAX protease family) [Myxococcota bacterium]|jgi:membrane protease YdiL (CAAX protease family)